jgi:AsmA-like protein
MSMLRKWWKTGAAVAAAVIAVQLVVSFLARTHRMHVYLIAHLERAFGRPVQVESFGARIFPNLQLSANGVTVGEDPAFGYEYFLRAEHLSAGLRWTGLLRGHFEFGTLSFSRPSLILVRNYQGQWNLERWLPPAKTASAQAAGIYGPPSPAPPVNHLQRIVFDEGRINFKIQEEKLPFAFTGVSGSFEQVSPGRWQLQLEAQPWRSGVLLQSTGTIRVRGDLAGTSARLQPAQIALHWSEASLADVFRLVHGQDYGARGFFALDVTAKSDGVTHDAPDDWIYSVQAHARQIHRWDLTEHADNPALNVNINGHWNAEAGSLFAEQFAVEGLRSNLRGKFRYIEENPAATELRLDSMGVQASDLLAWYRAFHPDVAEGITADPYFTGGMILRGWPLSIESAALSSNGGTVQVPGFVEPVRIGAVSGGLQRSNLVIGPVRVVLGGDARDVIAPKRHRIALAMENAADLTLTQSVKTSAGNVSIEGNISKVEDFLKLAASLGRRVNHGWELTGQATAVTQWAWKERFRGRWNGVVAINRGALTAAGLNQPLNLAEASLSWNDGQHAARLMKVQGFGGSWQGTIEENRRTTDDIARSWKFDLIVDHLNAAELDRWVGPRARPGWLQRLLQSFSGDAAPATPASELVRRVDAEGHLRVGHLTIEKLKLDNVVAQGSLRDLKLNVQESTAEWAGGHIRAKINASFLPQPVYEVRADLDRVSLAKLPGTGRLADRLNGSASGSLQLKTSGVGRDELLKNLDGSGVVNLKKVELRGWDLPASVADGATRAGVSRWPVGECAFLIRNRSVVLQWLQLNDPWEQTSVEGTLSFGSDAELSVSTHSRDVAKVHPKKTSAKEHVLKISGPLDGLRLTVEKTPEPPQVVN